MSLESKTTSAATTTTTAETNVESKGKGTVQEYSQVHTEDQNKAADSVAHIDKYTALAQLWFDEYNIQDLINPYFIELWHIQKIDNIPVNAYISVTKYTMQLVIQSHHVKWVLDYDQLWLYYRSPKIHYSTVEECAFNIKGFENTIKTIRYNKLNSLLQLPSQNAEVESIISIFGGETSNVELACGKCAICHEDTYITTECNHHVCVLCAEQCIEVTHTQRCPICRNSTGLAKLWSAHDRMQMLSQKHSSQETW